MGDTDSSLAQEVMASGDNTVKHCQHVAGKASLNYALNKSIQ